MRQDFMKNINTISCQVQNTQHHQLSYSEGKNSLVEVYNEVKTAYGVKAMNFMSVFKWCDEFKNFDQRIRRLTKFGRNKKCAQSRSQIDWMNFV